MSRRVKQKGVVALVFTMTVLAIITIITLFTARVVTTDTQIYNSVENNAAAYNAAQAGFNFGLGLLNSSAANYASIVTAAGALNSCTSAATTYTPTGGTLANGATYTYTYGCTAVGNTTTFTLSATGVQDGSTRKVSATIIRYGISPIITGPAAQATLANNTMSITNNFPLAKTTFQYGRNAGSSVTFAGSNVTTTTANGTPTYQCTGAFTSAVNGSGTGTGGTLCKDIIYNSGLNGQTTAQFLTAYTGQSVLTNFNAAISSGPTPITITACGAAITITATTTFTNIAANCTVNFGTTRACGGAVCAGGNTFNGITNGLVFFEMGGNTLRLRPAGGSVLSVGTTSPAAPVTLVITNSSGITLRGATGGATGDLTINGNIYTDSPITAFGGAGPHNAIVNGLIVSSLVGGTSITFGAASTGPANVNGGIAALSNIVNSGGVSPVTVTYSNANANFIANSYGAALTGAFTSASQPFGYVGIAALAYYAVVPGSWRDF